MSRPSPRLIHGLLRLRLNGVNLSTVSKPSSDAMSAFRDPVRFSSSPLSPSNGSSMFPSKLHFHSLSSNSTSSKLGLSQVFYCPRHNPRQCFNPLIRGLALAKPQPNFSSGIRFFSFKSSGLGKKVDGNFAKSIFDKPVAAITSAFSRYREAIGLQIDAFCKNNYLVLLGGGAVLVCALLWRIMFGIANTFVGISEGMAKYGFLALSTAIVAFFGLYLRSRFTINPDKVYRMAMRRLNTSAGVLEVMGAPLTGTDLRAYVMSGGGITLKTFKPSFRSKRCFLIFPIRGSERRGLVSVGVKNKKGQVCSINFHSLAYSF